VRDLHVVADHREDNAGAELDDGAYPQVGARAVRDLRAEGDADVRDDDLGASDQFSRV
jgi:hypothetical protein